MFCNYCRALNPEDALYCSACGRTIRLSPNAAKTQDALQNGDSISPPIELILPQSQNQTSLLQDDLPREAIEPTVQSTTTESAPSADPAVETGRNGPPSAPNSSPGLVVYGTLGQRFTAYLVDLIVIYLLVFIVYFISGALHAPLPAGEGDSQLLFFVSLLVYMIVAQAAYHTTMGKYLHGLEVRSEKPNSKYPAFWRILVRETVGRVFSSLFWGLGYWFAARKPKKQAWSDELAGTVVTARSTNRVLSRAFTAFVLLALVVDVVTIGYGFYKEDRDKRYAALNSEVQSASQDVVAARQAVDDQLKATKPVNDAFDLLAWQDSMKSLKRNLDRYEGQIDRVQTLLQRGISEDLVSSEAERAQLITLRQVYDIRKRQAEKLRQEADLVINSNWNTASMASLRNDLGLLDSDIDGLEQQAVKLLAQIGAK